MEPKARRLRLESLVCTCVASREVVRKSLVYHGSNCELGKELRRRYRERYGSEMKLLSEAIIALHAAPPIGAFQKYTLLP
jgi:hypothetical protein